jgi:hypothetical protein
MRVLSPIRYFCQGSSRFLVASFAFQATFPEFTTVHFGQELVEVLIR